MYRLILTKVSDRDNERVARINYFIKLVKLFLKYQTNKNKGKINNLLKGKTFFKYLVE